MNFKIDFVKNLLEKGEKVNIQVRGTPQIKCLLVKKNIVCMRTITVFTM